MVGMGDFVELDIHREVLLGVKAKGCRLHCNCSVGFLARTV